MLHEILTVELCHQRCLSVTELQPRVSSEEREGCLQGLIDSTEERKALSNVSALSSGATTSLCHGCFGRIRQTTAHLLACGHGWKLWA